MTASIVLNNLSDGYTEEVIVENIENQRCFTYTDNDSNSCEMCIYDDGLCFFKQSEDYLLELHLKESAYAKITSVEGIFKLNVKVVDFNYKGDILVVRYFIEDEERVIEIKYY